MASPNIQVKFNFHFQQLDEKGNAFLKIYASSEGNEDYIDNIFTYYGPYRLILETVASQAIGEIIMSKLKQLGRGK